MCKDKEGPSIGKRDGADDGSVASHTVLGRVPQGYDTRITFHIVPNRDVRITPSLFGCQPRRGAPRRDAEAIPLPPQLPEKLTNANRQILAWLSLDDGNARHFLAHPVDALMKAGVALSRDEQKALSRAHEAVRETVALPPGVNVMSVRVSTKARGRVGARPGSKPHGAEGHDCDCESRGEE